MIQTYIRCQENKAPGTTSHGCPNEIHVSGYWEGITAMRERAAEFGWVTRVHVRHNGQTVVQDFCATHAETMSGQDPTTADDLIEAERIRAERAADAWAQDNAPIIVGEAVPE